VTSPRQPDRRADIQGLRAIAVLLVVAFHAGLPLPGGFAGVDVFFVISGFVITGMLMREHAATGRIRLGRFYVRRFRRLTPALAVMVFVVVAVSFVLLPPLTHQVTFQTALGAMLLYANYAVARFTGGYFGAEATANPLLLTWTLSLEEQFYLIFPALLIAGWWIAHRSGRRGAVVVVAGAAGLVSLAVAIVTAGGVMLPLVPDGFVGFYGPLGRAWEFAAGAVLALVLPALPRLGRIVALVAGLLGAAALVTTALVLSGSTVMPGTATLLPVAGTLLLIVAGTTPNPVSTALSWRPVVAIGDLSYSWYLWHWPLIIFALLVWPDSAIALLLAAAVSLVPAYASYRWIENPIRAGHATRRRLAGLAAAVLVPPIALAGIGVALSDDGYGIPALQDTIAAQAPHAAYLAGCTSHEPVDDEYASGCVWNAGATGTPVYLVGDSIADAYSEGVIAAATELARPLTITVSAGCPVYPIVLRYGGERIDATDRQDCSAYNGSVQTWLAAQPPGLIVIAQTDTAPWEPSPAIPSDVGYGVPVEERAAAIDSALRNTVALLQQAGHTVVLSKAPPSYHWIGPAWAPTRCTMQELAADGCVATLTIEDLDVLQGPMRRIIDDIAADTGAGVFDPREHFCPDGICSTSRDGHIVYMDQLHISAAESLALTPDFVKVLDGD
jgi:peptidoglycan/LPS O-acetylase OafA/YrhL